VLPRRHAGAQNNIGVMYDNGRGVAKDEAQAVAWYHKAADQGDASAQYHLGLRYADGLGGVPKDEAQAAVWYRKAADQGHAGAQNNLGALYANGQGVQQSYTQAVRWYARAAQRGEEIAPRN
jgi:TPR repeat protein